MANNFGVQIIFEVVGNGVETVFTLDLLTGPYGFSVPSSTVPPIWFATDRKAMVPTGVFSPNPAFYTFSLSGTVLTTTFTTAPPANALTQANADLIF